MTAIGDIWYRYDGYYTQYEGQLFPKVHIYCQTYRVVKIMPASVELDNYKRVLLNARKRFAYPTKELAFESLYKRSQFRLLHTERAWIVAKAINQTATQLFKNKQLPPDELEIPVEEISDRIGDLIR